MTVLEQLRPPGGWGHYDATAHPGPTVPPATAPPAEAAQATTTPLQPRPARRNWRVPDWLDIARLAATDPQPGWERWAACDGADPDLFFPERGDSTRAAKQICAGCPVRYACLATQLAATTTTSGGPRTDMGIWGGTSARERRDAIRPALAQYQTAIERRSA